MKTTIHRHWRLLLFGLPVAMIAGVVMRVVLIPRPSNVLGPSTATASVDCVQLAKEFTDYPLLFAGAEVEGFPLTGCERVLSPGFAPAGIPPGDSFVFRYGTCTPSPEAGCPAPVQLTIDPPCGPTLVDEMKKEKVKIRGADAGVLVDGSIRIETKSYKLTVYGPGGDNDSESSDFGYESSKQGALRVAGKLKAANDLAADVSETSALDLPLKPNKVCR